MRVIYFGNNRIGLDVLRFLKGNDAEIVGLVVHPEQRNRYRSELIAESELNADSVFEADDLRSQSTLDAIQALAPELGLSIYFGYILKPEMLSIFPRGVLNLHPALLPYNRGAYPNVWSIVEVTPAGVSIHYVDAGIDTGNVISSREVPVLPTDTGLTLYRKLEDASSKLFEETWPAIVDGNPVTAPKSDNEGTYHRMSDVDQIDRIDLDATRTARELIDLIRARTFPPYAGAYFEENGQKIYLRLELLTEAELAAQTETMETPDAN